MRVLFITRKWPPAVGGMEIYSKELAESLAQKVDLRVNYLAGRHNGYPPTLASLAAFFFRQLWFLLRRRNEFDVIHYGDLVLLPLAQFCHLLGRQCRQVIAAHGTDIALPLRKGLKPAAYGQFLRLMTSVPQALDATIANSRATAMLCEKAGLPNVKVVPLGVSAVSALPNARERTGDYLLFVGRLVQRKGCGWFINEVLPRLPTNITLKVAGTIWDQSEGLLLKNPRIEFLGPVFGEDLSALRRNAIAVIMPNIDKPAGEFEGFGLTALEAGADGGILVAARLHGITDAVRDCETGFLLPSGDPTAWVDAIMEIASWSANQRAEFVRNAQEIISEFYSWDRVSADTLEIFEGRR